MPDDLYGTLREIRLPLEKQHQSAAPSMQDIVNVALKQFIKDWENPDRQPELLSELLEHRKLSRKRMGGRRNQPD